MSKQNLENLSDAILNYIVFDALGKNKGNYICVMDLENNYARWTSNAENDFENIHEYMHNAAGAWMNLVHPEDKGKIENDFDRIHRGVKGLNSEYRIRKRNGEYVWVKGALSYYDGGAGGMGWLINIVRDIGGASPVDSVTQLQNIYELDREVERHLVKSGETGALLYIGIDNFKVVNERYTYAGGNEVLRTFAGEIGKKLPQGSTLYRLDGDKFAVLYPRAEKEDVEGIFHMIQTVAGRLVISGYDIMELEVTGGASFYPTDAKAHGDFLRNADYSLEKAKKVKRNGLLYFSREMLEESLMGMQIVECLSDSVKNEYRWFELYFQPIVNSNTNMIVQYETLLRWNHPDYPDITPADFIPLLESTGLIVEVGKWILDKAIKIGKEWNDHYGKIVVNVNVSYIQMEQVDFCDYVLECVDKYHFPPELLVLELTESCRVKDMSGLCKVMERLRENHINVALDDFGTGYASLSVLRDVPVDWVKIDHNFVKQCKNDMVDRSIVKHIILLAHSIGIKVCVEGIENEDIHSVATEESADTLQGYFFGRPVRAEEFEKMMEEQETEWKIYGYGSPSMCL